MISFEFWLYFILISGGIGCTWVFCNMIVEQAYRSEARLKAIMAAFEPPPKRGKPPVVAGGLSGKKA